MSGDDERFEPEAYLTDGRRLLRVVSVETDERLGRRVWVENSFAVLNEESGARGFIKTWLTEQEVEGCEIVKSAPQVA